MSVINPAPDQTTLSIDNKSLTMKRDRSAQIEELKSYLCSVNNICEPINNYIKFQSCMNQTPEVKTLLMINQSVLLFNVLKSYIKNDINQDYMVIKDQPENLTESMTKTYDNLDALCESFTSSMKDVVRLIEEKQQSSTCCLHVSRVS